MTALDALLAEVEALDDPRVKALREIARLYKESGPPDWVVARAEALAQEVRDAAGNG